MDIIAQNFPAFLIGARNTLIYCFVSFPLALLIGLIPALMKGSPFASLSTSSRIFLLYCGIGAILANYDLAQYDNAWVAGIATLALNYAAYEAEVFRAGFLSVDRGQTEALLSLGLTPQQNFFRIVLPQAIPLMIPPFVNDFIYMLKDSAIVSVISGSELTSV